MNSALYYPTIKFQDYRWLWSASLIWDRIYRIVPDGVEIEDSENIKFLTEGGEIGKPIFPEKYATEVAKDFIDKLEAGEWDASVFVMDDDEEEYINLHKGKIGTELRNLITDKGMNSTEDWYQVPSNFGTLYMIYLANNIAKRNNLQVVSDFESAWVGNTYFNHATEIDDCIIPEMPGYLANLIINDITPFNISDIRPKDLLEFREKYSDERKRFVNSFRELATSISQCEDQSIIVDVIEDKKKEVKRAITDYKKSLGILKVKKWAGTLSLVIPILSGGVDKLFGNHIGPEYVKTLDSIGISTGLLWGLTSYKSDKVNLEKEFSYSYLYQLNSMWDKSKGAFRGSNQTFFRQMEEFIND